MADENGRASKTVKLEMIGCSVSGHQTGLLITGYDDVDASISGSTFHGVLDAIKIEASVQSQIEQAIAAKPEAERPAWRRKVIEFVKDAGEAVTFAVIAHQTGLA